MRQIRSSSIEIISHTNVPTLRFVSRRTTINKSVSYVINRRFRTESFSSETEKNPKLIRLRSMPAVLNMETCRHTLARFNQNANAANVVVPPVKRGFRARHRAACLAISYLSSSYSPRGSLVKSLRYLSLSLSLSRGTTIIIKDCR